ncbi:PREDICTED: carbonic anhydrase 13-like [Polistes canadensis]|uniref:carbonic anhydrase 13-like n=1 Tax=Polistes canadensis TaxID=91411 RepID=UPI000719024E|nr:PREDICTED: carbonic anhydrase 13-like [Polistes canadensis]
MLGFSWPELMIVSGSFIFLALLSSELIKWSHVFSENSLIQQCNSPIILFGYVAHNGPHTWKVFYPESNGYNQSPINITTTIAIEEYDEIEWIGHDEVPCSMIMANDGNSVIVCGTWCGDRAYPLIKGGPLTNTYKFHSMMFHWGPSDNEGSEHTINDVRYAMELQFVHVKSDLFSPFQAAILNAKDGVVIVSSFFNIIPVDNPYLDYIVTNLRYIKQPGSKVYIPPFPLSWLHNTEGNHYYAYHGSLTQPPCSEIVTWLIDPVPVPISSNQVAQFREICSNDGLLLTNCRPVQYLNGRDVYHYP